MGNIEWSAYGVIKSNTVRDVVSDIRPIVPNVGRLISPKRFDREISAVDRFYYWELLKNENSLKTAVTVYYFVVETDNSS